MREVLCRFKDEADLQTHFRDTFIFDKISGEELRLFERVNVRLQVGAAKCDLSVHVTRKQPLMIDDGLNPRMWRYTFRVQQGDAVWLQMFKSQLCTLAQFAA